MHAGTRFKAGWCLITLAALGCSRSLNESEAQTLVTIETAERVILYSIDIWK